MFYLKVENYSRGFCIEGFLVKVRNILIATLIISKSETEQEKLSPWKNVFVAQKQLMLMPSNERKKKISSNLKKKGFLFEAPSRKRKVL